MRTYSIKELENFSGTKAHTIRIWEQRYNLLTPQRTETGIRFYSDDDLKKILSTVVLLKSGYKISKIGQLSPEKMKNELDKIDETSTNSDVKFELAISNLLEAGLSFDEQKMNLEFEKLGTYLDTFALFTQVVYPLLNRLGVMWGKDDINPIQEHFISNCIRQKLLVETNKLPISEDSENQIVLFLPESETHEIGLMFSNYLLRKANIKTLYIGQQVPLINLTKFLNQFNIKTAIGFISMFPGEEKINKILVTLSTECPETSFYWNKSIVTPEKIQNMKNHHLVLNIEDFQEKIINLKKGDAK